MTSASKLLHSAPVTAITSMTTRHPKSCASVRLYPLKCPMSVKLSFALYQSARGCTEQGNLLSRSTLCIRGSIYFCVDSSCVPLDVSSPPAADQLPRDIRLSPAGITTGDASQVRLNLAQPTSGIEPRSHPGIRQLTHPRASRSYSHNQSHSRHR